MDRERAGCSRTLAGSGRPGRPAAIDLAAQKSVSEHAEDLIDKELKPRAAKRSRKQSGD